MPQICIAMDTLFHLSKEDNLLKRFEEIHNYIYANDGLSTQQTLEEITKVLFVKISDEKNGANEFRINLEELNEIKQTGTSDSFSKRITKLFQKTKTVFREVFDSDDKIRLSNISLAYTVNKLQNISLSDSSFDAKGLAFQKFLARHEKDGRGQFFTPEPVIRFCVDIIKPQMDELIIDPACGSGGFLNASLQYIIKNNKGVNIKEIIANNVFGLDINKSIARIAKMKLLLEANGKSNIICTNSLDDFDEILLSLSNLTTNTIDNGFDVLLTNPPFGTVGRITNTKILSRFDLGHKWKYDGNYHIKTSTIQNSQVAEILFIERCLQFLKEGGRLGIVLPNGHFENSSLEYLREYIKTKASILAIINLPQETFIPYGTGVKTSLLFLEKTTLERKDKYRIFFSKINKLGYQGNKNGTPIYKKDKYGLNIKNTDGNFIIDEDFSDVVKDYTSFLNNNSILSNNSYSLLNTDLLSRFDYPYYSPDNRELIRFLESKNAVRLGDVAEIVKGKSKKLKHSNHVVEYVELSDINTHSFEIINSTSMYVYDLPSRATFEIKTDDILTAVAGNSIGTRKHATALVSDQFNGCICTNGFRIFRKLQIDKYYLLFYFQSEYFLKQVYKNRTGAAIPSLSDIDLLNILIYLPDNKTLEKISNAVKTSFELREQSLNILKDIEL